MMMHAYDYNLFYKAQNSLAWMFDYAVNDCHYSITDFWNMFLESSYSKRYEVGESTVVAGMSGIEIAYYIILEKNPGAIFIEPEYKSFRSKEYWAGWFIAYYQWSRNINFSKVTEWVDINNVLDMYDIYHEMDIEVASEKFDEMRHDARRYTALQRYRTLLGISQNELAEKTSIPLKTIQQYEQGRKNINHARAEYVIKLADVLYCSPKDLMES